MTMLGRDLGEIDALVTDRYLDSLLAGRDTLAAAGPVAIVAEAGRGRAQAGIDEAVRLVSRRLAGDLPRFHPSFRFEERLALRLAEAAAAMRLPLAAGGERDVLAAPISLRGLADPLAAPIHDDESDPRAVQRPFLVSGAVAASALSLAGAAWLAWRRRGAGSPMARAARAAHQARAGRIDGVPAGGRG